MADTYTSNYNLTKIEEGSTGWAGKANGNMDSIDSALKGIYDNISNGTYYPTVSVKTFGAVGDGSSDDTEKIQNAIDTVSSTSFGIYFPPGTYRSKKIILPSGIRIVGAGASKSSIKALSSIPDSDPLIVNQVIFGSVDTYYDKDIFISDITFDGNNIGGGGGSRTRNTELISFSKSERIKLDRVVIKDHQYIGIAFGGNRFVTMSDCELTNIGDHTPSALSGPAVWLGQTGDGSFNKYCNFERLYIHDTYEAGFSLSSQKIKITDCVIEDVDECGIFMNSTCDDVDISNNTISGVDKMWISSSGIEAAGTNVKINNNRINNTDADNISITDGQSFTIVGNVFSTPRMDGTSFPQAAIINIITTASSGSQPRGISIIGNTVGSGSPYAFVGIGNSGAAVEHIAIENNVMTGITFTSGSPWNFTLSKVGSNVFVRNNTGVGINTFISETQTKATTGNQVITGVGFYPRRIDITVIKASGTSIERCDSVTSWNEYSGSSYAVCHYYATNGAASVGSTGGSNAINLVSPTGTNDIIATLTARSNDGFTLNYTVTNFQGWMRYVCYP